MDIYKHHTIDQNSTNCNGAGCKEHACANQKGACLKQNLEGFSEIEEEEEEEELPSQELVSGGQGYCKQTWSNGRSMQAFFHSGAPALLDRAGELCDVLPSRLRCPVVWILGELCH